VDHVTQGQLHEDGQHEELEDHQKQVGVAAALIPMTLRIEVMMWRDAGQRVPQST
jgi:hypothetical protein